MDRANAAVIIGSVRMFLDKIQGQVDRLKKNSKQDYTVEFVMGQSRRLKAGGYDLSLVAKIRKRKEETSVGKL